MNFSNKKNINEVPREANCIGLFDVSFLCTYYISENSKWEKWGSGVPIDGYKKSDRYSVHTEEEFGPFIHFDLPCPLNVEAIDIITRDVYVDKVLPIDVDINMENGEVLSEIVRNIGNNLIPIGGSVQSVRLHKRCFGYLNISSIRIFIKQDEITNLIRGLKLTSHGLAYVLADFYGIGGKLSIVATALGYLSYQSSVKNIVLDQSFGELICFPPVVVAKEEAWLQVLMNKYLPSHLISYINDRKGYNSKKNISMYMATGDSNVCNQAKKFCLVTRDSIKSYQLPSEPFSSCAQRLYSRIIPSKKVLDLVENILTSNRLSSSVLSKTLGVHIRHGNGERYCSGDIWA